MDTEQYNSIITILESIESAVYEYGEAFDSYLNDIATSAQNWLPVISIAVLCIIGLKVLYNSLR